MLNLENKIDMHFEQYDKLEQNVKKSVKHILDLKTENNRLRKEVEQLRKQLENTSERGIKKLNNRNIEKSQRKNRNVSVSVGWSDKKNEKLHYGCWVLKKGKWCQLKK